MECIAGRMPGDFAIGALNARPAIYDCAVPGPGRARRVHLLRHLEEDRNRQRHQARPGLQRRGNRQARGSEGQVGNGRRHDDQEDRRQMADRRADHGARGRLGGHEPHERAGPAGDRPGGRRETGRSQGVRPRHAAHRDRLQVHRRQALRQAAGRRQDTDQRRPLREAQRRAARLPHSGLSGRRRSTSRRSTCATRRSSRSSATRSTASR